MRSNRAPLPLAVLVALAGCTPADEEASDVLHEELDARAEIEAVGPQPGRFASPDARGEQVEVDEWGAARSIQPEAARSWFIDAAEIEARRGSGGPTRTPPPTMTERTIDRARARPADEQLRLLVKVDAPAFDFKTLRGTAGSARRSLIEGRKSSVQTAQARVEPDLAALGATVIGRRWISTHLVVEARAGDVETIAKLPGVAEVVIDDPGQSNAIYDGWDVRHQLLTDHMIDSGFDSLQGAREGDGRIRIGIIEADGASPRANWPDPDHVGWLTWPTSTYNRLRAVDSCSATSCTATTPGTTGNTHGSCVTWAAGGDLTDGQDPDHGGAVARERRSGVAVESRLFYYNGGNFCSGYETALEQAVTDDLDVVNMSLSIPAGQCDEDYDCMTDAIVAAHDAGILVVAAAGNNGHDGNCTLAYPALRPHVLAVGGTESDDTVAYNDQQLLDRMVNGTRVWSAQGPVPITLNAGGARDTAGVDLLAPGVLRYNFTDADNYNTGAWWAGTSMAAPIASGIAANLRDFYESIGWNGPANEAEPLMINMLVLGDNWDFDIDADRTERISDTSGFGRLKVHFPSGASLNGPWGWGWRSEHLDQGETKTWTVGGSGAESTAVDEFKWAVTWFDPDMNDASDVVIQLWNTCPSGGGQQLVAWDMTYNLRKSVHLLGEDIGNRCLEMRAIAYDTRPGGVWIYSADYWHSGDPEEH